MEQAEFIKRSFEQLITVELEDDGYWKCLATLKDRGMMLGDDKWIEEEISAMSIDTNPQRAIETAMGANLKYMNEIVYASGFKGLIEYKIFEKEVKNASIKA